MFRVCTNKTTFPLLVAIPSRKEEVSSAAGSVSEDEVKSVEAVLDRGNNSTKSSCGILFLNYKELSQIGRLLI